VQIEHAARFVRLLRDFFAEDAAAPSGFAAS
jgi:hypothetical protein